MTLINSWCNYKRNHVITEQVMVYNTFSLTWLTKLFPPQDFLDALKGSDMDDDPGVKVV